MGRGRGVSSFGRIVTQSFFVVPFVFVGQRFVPLVASTVPGKNEVQKYTYFPMRQNIISV